MKTTRPVSKSKNAGNNDDLTLENIESRVEGFRAAAAPARNAKKLRDQVRLTNQRAKAALLK
jgi:hypothetical protein